MFKNCLEKKKQDEELLNKLQNNRDNSGKYLQEEEFVWETIVMAGNWL